MPRKVIKVWNDKTVALIIVSAPGEGEAEELAKDVYESLQGKYQAVMWAGGA